jgi:hypothetical protein
MLHRVALVRADVSEEFSAIIIHFVFLRSVRRLLVTANIVPSSPILVTQMMEALISSETSVLTRATRCTSRKTQFLRVTNLENTKSYKNKLNSVPLLGNRSMLIEMPLLVGEVSDSFCG